MFCNLNYTINLLKLKTVKEFKTKGQLTTIQNFQKDEENLWTSVVSMRKPKLSRLITRAWLNRASQLNGLTVVSTFANNNITALIHSQDFRTYAIFVWKPSIASDNSTFE